MPGVRHRVRQSGGDVRSRTTPLLRLTTWLAFVLGTVYAVTLVPGVGPAGYSPALDWWLNMTVDGLVILVLAQRTVAVRGARVAWALMTLGLVVAFVASTAYFSYYRHLDPIPSPSPA